MNALNVIGTAVNLAFFVLVLAGTLAILDEEGKTSVRLPPPDRQMQRNTKH